jgi:hypothetical protein
MEPHATTEASSAARLIDSATRLEQLGHDLVALAEVRRQLEQFQAERDQLQERVAHLEAECERLRAERTQLLVAFSRASISYEELNRRSQEQGGCGLAEFWAGVGVP